jgi:hypothetical protein
MKGDSMNWHGWKWVFTKYPLGVVFHRMSGLVSHFFVLHSLNHHPQRAFCENPPLRAFSENPPLRAFSENPLEWWFTESTIKQWENHPWLLTNHHPQRAFGENPLRWKPASPNSLGSCLIAFIHLIPTLCCCATRGQYYKTFYSGRLHFLW